MSMTLKKHRMHTNSRQEAAIVCEGPKCNPRGRELWGEDDRRGSDGEREADATTMHASTSQGDISAVT